MLTATGLIERRAADEVAVGRDRAVTEQRGHGIPCPRPTAGISELADALDRSEDGGVRGLSKLSP